MLDYSFPLEELEYFLLILVRVSAFIYTAPFFSLNNVPRNVKVVLSFFIAFLLYNAVPNREYVVYSSILGYTAYILKEAIAGLILGLSTQFCMMILNFAGHMVDVEIGFSMAQTFDPTTNQQSTVTSTYYTNAIMLLMMITGMYQYLLQALAETFELIPVGKVEFSLEDLYQGMLTFMSDYMILGFRICLPVFCVILLLNCFLGIMAKVSPQMNMFAIGMQLKVLVGLGVLVLTVSMLPGAANIIFEQMKVMLVTFVKAMGGG